MKAPSSLAAQGTYGPDALNAINRAFDEAWADIAGNLGDDPLAVQAAREKLADPVLRSADQGCLDVEALKSAALDAVRSMRSDRVSACSAE